MKIQQLVRQGRITPREGAQLLELRRVLRRARELKAAPWYLRPLMRLLDKAVDNL